MNVNAELDLSFNPFKAKGKKIEILDLSFDKLMELFEKFCELNDINHDQREVIRDLLLQAYRQQRIEALLSTKLDILHNKIQSIFTGDMKTINSKDVGDKKDLYYLKKTKHTLSYE